MIKAQYTVVLNSLLNDEVTKAEIEKALSEYPLYQPQKTYDIIPNRSELNQRLLNHYKYREIGFETVGRFIDELKNTMCEIMPRYNELYKSCEIMAELPSPFDNVDVVETYKEEKTTEATANSSSNTEVNASDNSNSQSSVNSNSKSVKAGTPQSELDIPAQNIDSIKYADEVNWNKNNSSDTSETSGNSNSESTSESTGETSSSEITEHTYTKKGNQGVNTYAHDMNEFRTSIIDVTNKIITDPRINELFMLVY